MVAAEIGDEPRRCHVRARRRRHRLRRGDEARCDERVGCREPVREPRDRFIRELGEHRVDRDAEAAARVTTAERLEVRQEPAVDRARDDRPHQLHLIGREVEPVREASHRRHLGGDAAQRIDRARRPARGRSSARPRRARGPPADTSAPACARTPSVPPSLPPPTFGRYYDRSRFKSDAVGPSRPCGRTGSPRAPGARASAARGEPGTAASGNGRGS